MNQVKANPETTTSPPVVDQAQEAMILATIQEISHIATLPEITLRIIRIVEDPDSSAQDLNKIITNVESDSYYLTHVHAEHPTPEGTVSDAITLAAREVAESIKARCIITYTTSGSTTLRASRERPTVPILCITSSLATARRLAMAWGVHAVHMAEEQRFSAVVQRATEIAKRDEFGDSGDKVVITAGVPMGTPGSTNVLRVERIP